MRSRAAQALAAAALALLAGCASVAPPLDPPAAPREFRAAWVASVANIDWPSRKGLSSAQQQAEIVAIVERAAALGLNALIVQVRPSADALYPSALEPWSEYLTGTQGQAPEPPYDPLQRWVEEAHRRGIELHAWFNPYRARHSAALSPIAPNHIARTDPAVVKSYGNFLWMDPGEPAAAQRTVDVVLDVVRRYDLDGVHIDDYFYPYPESTGTPPVEVEFPDGPSWQAYLASGGTLARADWRRRNVDTLIERLHAAIHREKPAVRFGISPFGIGKPERRPSGIAGFSQYDKLYADVERWVRQGWFDYLAPQLYWPIDSPPQAFAVLLDYWLDENVQQRHVWPGLFTSRIDATPKSWLPAEIVDQVSLLRTRRRAGGHIHFSMVALMENRKGIADRLEEIYGEPAWVPAAPWLGDERPDAPRASALRVAGHVTVRLAIPAGKPAWLHGLWARYGSRWRFYSAPATQAGIDIPSASVDGPLEALVASSVNRLGIESERVGVALPSP